MQCHVITSPCSRHTSGTQSVSHARKQNIHAHENKNNMYFVSHLSWIRVPALIKEASLRQMKTIIENCNWTLCRDGRSWRVQHQCICISPLLYPLKHGQNDCKTQSSRKPAVKLSLLEMAAQTRREPCQHPWTHSWERRNPVVSHS